MKRKLRKALYIFIASLIITGCQKGNSKVDDVIQSQMQQENGKNASSEEPTYAPQLPNPQATTEATTELASYDTEESKEEDQLANPEEGIDVDLTQLSATMVYSEVYNMMMTPEDYIGKTVRMSGDFAVYQDENTGQRYYACIINDATACCAQGIEFDLEGEYSFPEDYPVVGAPIMVTGVFETYNEGNFRYCRLKNAWM